MATSASAKRLLPTVQVNDAGPIVVEPHETVLAAALRGGVPFPYSCRVGGCGSCKCKLTAGAVTELTESGYLLTADELDQGYILACQSVPRGDVTVQVLLPEKMERARVAGRVVSKKKLTADITHVSVRLNEPLSYRAGQYAEVSFPSEPALQGVVRSYSFASKPGSDGLVSFFVRKVEGGQMSTFLNDQDAVGASVTVDGPLGDFWLRSSNAPLLLVAGGSGLAPLLSILEQAAALNDTRSVTLVFGARTQADLYATAAIEAIATTWKGEFRFVPVLSQAARDETWTGARGLVTDVLPKLVTPTAEAYLCGPPAMIDAVMVVLEEAGVAKDHVFADRFLTRADVVTAPAAHTAKTAGVLDYAKYFLFHLVGLFAVTSLLAGGRYTTAGLFTVLAFYIIGDAIAGDDTSTPVYERPTILTVQLWMALPLLALVVFSGVWSVCAGDPLGFGAAVQRLTSYDVISARNATTFGHHVSGWVITGLMIGMIGTITAHELTHRTWDKVSLFFGRWLLAFSFDTTFAIEHVYGHHRYVSTLEDPATAPRGRNVYAHILISTLKGNVSAWHIERARLQKKRLALLGVHNTFLRGHLMSVALVGIAFAMGGLRAAAFFIACALWGKALLEIVNYMEHYGLVRDPETPVQPRHSWNTNKRVSSWSMFNLTRHSHHHAQGEAPYQKLRPYPDAPMMINGYLTTLVVALVPPLWHHLMTKKVLAWDEKYATPTERALAANANAASGLPILAVTSSFGRSHRSSPAAFRRTWQGPRRTPSSRASS
jgi:NAD(P)H-flavin reductase/ferredoxin